MEPSRIKEFSLDHCMNKQCPWWKKKIGDHCGNPGEVEEFWIEKFCLDQPKEKATTKNGGGF